MAKRNRRRDGIKVTSEIMEISVSHEAHSRTNTHTPQPNAASMVAFPIAVCAKETAQGEVSTRGIKRNSARRPNFGPRGFVWVTKAIPVQGDFDEASIVSRGLNVESLPT